VSGAFLPTVGERLPDWRIGPFDAAALAAYAEASGDANPLHLDDDLALAIGFPAPPVHGMKLLAAFEPLLSRLKRYKKKEKNKQEKRVVDKTTK
jgi:acyl dehydratase